VANPNAPYGLKPVRYLNGAPYNAQAISYHVPASYGPAMFLGDPVILTGTGNLNTVQGFQPGSLADIALTAIPGAGGSSPPALTFGQYTIGTVVGILPVTRESTIYRAAGVEAVILVETDPFVIYRIRDNGGATLGVTAIGANANMYSGAGSTTTGQSGYTLDAGLTTPVGTSLNLQLSILAAANEINNDVTSPFCQWDVVINWHPYSAPSIGI
jgi:hypothetical protein